MNDNEQNIMDSIDTINKNYRRLMLVEQERSELLFQACKTLMVGLRDAGRAIHNLDDGDATSRTGWKSDEALAAFESIHETFATVTKLLSKEFNR